MRGHLLFGPVSIDSDAVTENPSPGTDGRYPDPVKRRRTANLFGRHQRDGRDDLVSLGECGDTDLITRQNRCLDNRYGNGAGDGACEVENRRCGIGGDGGWYGAIQVVLNWGLRDNGPCRGQSLRTIVREAEVEKLTGLFETKQVPTGAEYDRMEFEVVSPGRDDD
jgi:hypothetical protein